MLLNSVLHPQRTSQKHKPTIADAQSDFLLHVRSINDLQPKLDKLRADFATEKKKMQPKIIVIGQELQDLKEFYVFCDGVKYKLCTFTKCLDVIIKLFYVYQMEYSHVSKLVWIFLEQFFFYFKSEKYSEVSNLIHKLKN